MKYYVKLILLLLPVTAFSADDMISPEVFVPEDRTAYDTVGLSPMVRVGDMLYLSGVIGTPVERDAGDEALEANFVSIFEQIKATLESVGASFDNVVTLKTYRLDYVKNFPLFLEVKKRYIKEPYPTWTDLGISALPPGAMAEVQVDVWLGGTRKVAQ